MSSLNRLFSIRFTKKLMIIACYLLIIASIWFLGPFFGFGQTRPLEKIDARVVFIALALICLIGRWFSVPVFILAAIILSGLTWVITPFLLIGNHYPFIGVMPRVIAISCIIFITLLYGCWRLLLAIRKNPKLLDSYIIDKGNKSEQHVTEVAAMIRNAAKYIKSIHKNVSRWRFFFTSKGSLNELPWYMVIGPEGAGKTSVILSSGQDFPLPEQLNRVCKESLPTKNCECWFANDALFIDTAGKYLDNTQENKPEWDTLVKSIKKYRPIKAINGVIVTISASDVMGRNKTELVDLSSKIRARLDDLRNVLGVRFPVYVLMTKLDQIPGFVEYFRTLTSEDREQIWGVTFPYGEEMTASVAELREHVVAELTLLENRIENDMNVRQQEEYETADRKKMYSLPQDFRALSQGVADVLQNIFSVSRYDETQRYTTLRGIYFTSSNQPANLSLLNNSTLIQKWRNYADHKKTSSIASLSQQVDDTEMLVTGVAYGRQYFLKKLFSEIIIKDAGLARYNLKVESQYRFQNIFGHAACIAAAIFLLYGIVNSYYNNTRYLRAVDIKVDDLNDGLQGFVKKSNESLLPSLLKMSMSLPEFTGLNVLNPDLAFRYGLYAGSDVVKDSDGLYHYLLQRLLFPLIQKSASDFLQNSVFEGDNSADIYEKFKLYLMVFNDGKFDQNYMVNNITQQWETSGKIEPYEEKSIFVSHLNNLFGHPNWDIYGQPMDPELVKYVRNVIDKKTLATRLYERIKVISEADAPTNMTLSKMTGEQTSEILTVANTNLKNNGIPGLFTYAGYHQVFKKKLNDSVGKLHGEDNWIMGKKDDSSLHTVSDLAGKAKAQWSDPVKDEVLNLYLREYTYQWKMLLSSIQLKSDRAIQSKKGAGLSFDIYALHALVSADSPLVNLAKQAVKETTLAVQEKSTVNVPKIPNVNSQALNNAAKINNVLAFRDKKMLVEGVDRHFSALREFVSGNVQSTQKDSNDVTSNATQLSTLLGMLRDQYTQLVISDHAIKEGDTSPSLSDSGQKLSVESTTWPEPFRNIIEPLLIGVHKRINQKIVSNSNKTIELSLGEVCKKTLKGRYPFANSQREVNVSDFERFFAEDGLVDEYFKKNLADKVDTSFHPWRYKGDLDDASSGNLEVFEQAEKIRRAFFQDDGRKKMAINFSLDIPYMDPSITKINLNVDGENMRYAHGPVTPNFFKWPGSRFGAVVYLTAKPAVSPATSNVMMTGSWSLLHWIDRAQEVKTSTSGKKLLTFKLDNRRIYIDTSGLSYDGDLSVKLLRSFRCPGTV
ncbi:type VI secretion system membrane subunit TssM [Rouxiella sp. Mn2063]|uniref:type VI secretion system membrane subunit TssM n=1 Tax=Rouxiella sp. Mn2063 TaxID=3395262 RepID=UPI003BEBD2FD